MDDVQKQEENIIFLNRGYLRNLAGQSPSYVWIFKKEISGVNV